MALKIQLISDEDCKTILAIICKKLCVRPRLVVERLLDEDAKNEMRNGDFPVEALEAHIKVWLENGMPDYVNGTCKLLRDEISH